MLQKLNTSFFYKNIFININEKRKLLLIKYNKNLQNILDIKLINYITLSGKFLKQETKEKTGNDNIRTGKIFASEYNYDGKLKFEGEYLNGKKWNGKGYDKNKNVIYELKNGDGFIKIFYTENKLKFEGEIKKGEKNGNGKEYDKNGNVIYELKNGNGFIKEYGYNLNLIFEGNYLNGERNGKGKEYYLNKLIFEGEYLNGEKNGQGKEYDQKGKLLYEGEYLNGKIWNGKTREFIIGKI